MNSVNSACPAVPLFIHDSDGKAYSKKAERNLIGAGRAHSFNLTEHTEDTEKDNSFLFRLRRKVIRFKLCAL
jgi:hypothetical protein